MKKIARMAISVFLIATIAFLLLSMIPGDPATAILGLDRTPEEIEALREALGLNKPVLVRYIAWIKGAISFDFGISYKYSEPVVQLIASRLPLTLRIAFIALGITLCVSIPISFAIYKCKNQRIRKIFDIIMGITISMPSFWLGIISLFIFGVIMHVAKMGYDGTMSSLILPCIVVAVPKIGTITRFLVGNLEVETRREYIKYFYANGLQMKWLNLYVFKNSILSVIPLLGMMVIDLITGIVIIEQIFSIPGVGRLMITALTSRDIPLIQGLVFYTSVSLVLINFLIDIVYTLIDPRIR